MTKGPRRSSLGHADPCHLRSDQGEEACRRKRIVLLTATIGLGLASLAAAQQEGAKGVVAIRQATMDANAKHMNAIKAILTEDPQLIKLVAFHAEAIAEAAEYVPEMFPEGSTQTAYGGAAGDLGEARPVQAGRGASARAGGKARRDRARR